MSAKDDPATTRQERESLEVAEAAREKEWKQPSFMKQLFLGSFRLDLIHPYPSTDHERPEFAAFYQRMKRFLDEEVDSAEIDATGEYPPQVVDGLRRMGDLILISDDFHVEGEGEVDVTGQLNYELSAYLSPSLSQRVASRLTEGKRLGPIPILAALVQSFRFFQIFLFLDLTRCWILSIAAASFFGAASGWPAAPRL